MGNSSYKVFFGGLQPKPGSAAFHIGRGQAGPVLKFCEKFMPTLAGIGPEVWLHDLLEPGQQAYLCRCALAVLKHTEVCPEANCALEAFHVAVRKVSTDAADLLQLVSGELLSELRAGKLI